jgi:aryl-alcohol dehydrogenase-like predicted oxidoreductase
MIERMPFGQTGHVSTRTIFGAAALGAMRQERADRLLETLLERGVNHIDTAAAYGDAELRIAPWMQRHRDEFFLASKTGDRTYEAARDSIRRSLDRLRVDRLDLIQLHNLVDEGEWQTAMGPGGALEAALEAREQGLVRFIGVTGHGTRVAERHLQSLERFDFDSVLLPYNLPMMSQPEYAADFEALYALCEQRGIAMQTIKSVARRRWQDESQPRYSWYEPLKDPDAIRHAVHWVLRRPRLFLNTSSDATILPLILDAAESAGAEADEKALLEDVARYEMEPLFERGVTDQV